LANEKCKKQIANIENKIKIEFESNFLIFQRYNRNNKRTIHIYEHTKTDYMIQLIYLNSDDKNIIVEMSYVEKIKEYSTFNSPNKLIRKNEIKIENEEEILRKFRGYKREIELKGIFK
jgi:hypothetical protein